MQTVVKNSALIIYEAWPPERTPPSESFSKEFCRLRNFRVDHLRNYYIAISDLWYGRPMASFEVIVA